MDPAAIARVVHEANRALQIEQADPSISPASPWDECSEEMRASAVDGVKNVIEGATPEESHENWCRFKRDHGWVYGERKSEADKTHPCLVPYAELPEHQQVKDHLFGAIVGALAEVAYSGRVRLDVPASGGVKIEIGTALTSIGDGGDGSPKLTEESRSAISMHTAGKLLRKLGDQLVENALADSLEDD